MAVEVDFLIEKWQDIRKVLAPGRILDRTPSAERDAAERELLELSLVSSRKEYWYVYVMLMAFSSETATDPREALAAIPFNFLFNNPAVLDGKNEWNRAGSFLTFSSQFAFVESRPFVVAAYTIDRQIQSFVSTVENFSSATNLLKECMEANPVPPKTYNDIAQCVRKGLTQARSQVAAVAYAT